MRAKVLSPEFAAATKRAAKFTAKRSTLPVCNNTMLETGHNEITLTSTDLETTLVQRIQANVAEPGSITLPAAMLAELAGRADSETTEITITAEEPHTATITGGRQSARISGIDSEDFPPVPGHFHIATATLDAQQFAENAKQVAANADKKRDWQPALQAIHFSLDNGRLTMAAADGFRLGVRRLATWDDSIRHAEFHVPAESITKVLSLIPKRSHDALIYVALSRSHVAFSIEECIVICTLANVNTPDYAGVIPEQADTDIVLNRADFLEAVKVADTFARRNGGTVRLAANGLDALRISAKFHDDCGGVSEVAGRIPAVVIYQDSPASQYISDNLPEPITGLPKAEVSINGAYLVGALAKLTSDNVCLGVSSPETAVLFTPMNGRTMDLDNQTVIMPIYHKGREKLPEFSAWTSQPLPEPPPDIMPVETAELSAVC